MQNNLDKWGRGTGRETLFSRDGEELTVYVGVIKDDKTSWGATSTAAVLQKKI